MKTNMDKVINDKKYTINQDDLDFFYSDEARGFRLQVDYLKAEHKMKEAGIEHTIVVFGSARVTEENDKMNAYSEARKFGQLVGKSGNGPKDSKVTLMTGGGPGIMEAANRGAYDVGAKSIGLNIKLPHEQKANKYITPELSFQFFYFGMRKLHFMQRAKALVVFPGGFGTLDELFEILTLVQTKKKELIPIVLINKEFWENSINFDNFLNEGLIDTENLNLFIYKENAQEAWTSIQEWYADKNSTIFK